MLRRVAYLTVAAGLVSTLTGCALNFFEFEQRASWRDAEARACLARRPASSYIEQVRSIDGKGVCGINHPLKVYALEGGTIGIGPNATIGCPMTEALEGWMRASVQPAALAWFGVPVVEIKQISAYYCRTKNSVRGADLSEHAFGNALDVAGFKLADGRTVTVLKGWKGAQDERAFLREVFATACASFKTALGPGAKYHSDHFHLDLARHNADGTSQYCNPKPSVVPPLRQPFDGTLVAAIPGQPRYNAAVREGTIESMLGVLSYAPGERTLAVPLPEVELEPAHP